MSNYSNDSRLRAKSTDEWERPK